MSLCSARMYVTACPRGQYRPLHLLDRAAAARERAKPARTSTSTLGAAGEYAPRNRREIAEKSPRSPPNEGVVVGEAFWVDEIENGPKLPHVVL